MTRPRAGETQRRGPDSHGLRRLLVRAGLGLAVALVLLGVVEGVARLVLGSPPPPPTIRRYHDFFDPLLEIRDGLVCPVFQGKDAIAPFALHKRPGRPRVLFVGGSSVRSGSGLGPESEFPALVERALRDRGVDVEVLNFGRAGFDTGDIRLLLERARPLEPDVVVCYAGHNDIGNLTFHERYGNVRSALAARVRIALQQTRTFLLLERALVRPSRAFGLRTVARPADFPRVEPGRIRMGESLFRRNLDRIARDVLESQAGLVLATVIADEVGCAPSAPSCPDLIPPGSGALVDGVWRLDLDPPGLTLEAVRAGLARDPDCADLLYLEGRLLGPGDPKGVEAFRQARDRDPVPIRATPGILEAIRDVARERGATLVDLDALARREGGGIPPQGWFTDQMHLSPLGHRRVAEALVDPVAQALPPGERRGGIDAAGPR
ncbi:MAG: SGNH/GDSL hydrolase family protein [Deltaproteobacteria bacterium]|nr:SGNH/GDSL hydrolase family protein [Deltaproteobacteria bacterium]